jgi:hypothetical protein
MRMLSTSSARHMVSLRLTAMERLKPTILYTPPSVPHLYYPPYIPFPSPFPSGTLSSPQRIGGGLVPTSHTP